MSIDEQHVALPKLYGAPAYARPQPVVAIGPRPFDPDDLPIEAVRTDEERAMIDNLPAHAWAPGGSFIRMDGQSQHNGTQTSTGLTARSFSLRHIAGRLLGGD